MTLASPRYVTMTATIAVVATALAGCSAVDDASSASASQPPTVPAVAAPYWDGPFDNPELDGTTPIRVAAVNAPSARFDVAAGLAETARIAEAAAADGVELLAFPELWMPGFINNTPSALYAKAPDDFQVYVDNSVEEGDANWTELSRIADEFDLYLSMGLSEKVPAEDRLYMTQVMFGPDGTTVQKHRKTRPSGGERAFFSDIDITPDVFSVSNTPLGRIGTLSCGENLRPQIAYNTQALGENIHIAAWPYTLENGGEGARWEQEQMAHVNSAGYAATNGAWVIKPSVGISAIYNGFGEMVARATNADSDYAVATVDRTGFDEPTVRAAFSPSGLDTLVDAYPLERTPVPVVEELNTPDWDEPDYSWQ